MTVFAVALVASAFLCALVAGFLFAYAVVIMPGIKGLDDRAFIKAFQITDRVIQDNNPLFIVVWLGSAVALIVCVLSGFAALEGMDLLLLIVAAIAYLGGVQLSTVVVHLPLNNQLQTHDVDAMSAEELRAARAGFESRWNRSNEIRTAIACAVSLVLIVLASGQ